MIVGFNPYLINLVCGQMLRYINDLLNRLKKQEKGIFKEEQLEAIKVLITEGAFEDALKQLADIEKQPDISTEIQLSCQILRCNVLHDTSKYEEGLALAQDALNKSKNLANNLLILDSLIAMNNHLYRLGRFDEGLTFVGQAEEIIKLLKKEFSDKILYEREFFLTNRKGAFLHGKGDLEQAINQFKKCSTIAEKVDDDNLVTQSLNNIGLSYFHIGEMEKALDYLERNLLLLQNRKDIISLGLALNNTARVYSFLGELDVALEYLTRGLDAHKQTGNKLFQAASLFYIGKVYQRKGDFKQSYKNYSDSLKLRTEIGNEVDMSEVLFELISLTLAYEMKIDKTEKYFATLKEINERQENAVINQRTKIAEALLLRRSDRTIQKAQAQMIFQEIANEDVVDYQLTVFSLLRLFELLLFELKATENEKVLEELETLSNKISTIAKTHNSYPLLAEIYLLQSKLALLKLDLDWAYESLGNALETANDKGLVYLVQRISSEKEILEGELAKWEDITKRKGSIQERIDLVDIGDSIIFTENIDQKPIQSQDKTSKIEYDRKQISMLAYRFEKKGICKFVDIGASLLNEVEEKKLGTFLSISVALGSEYYTGLYGPLPVAGHPQHETLVYAELLNDSSSPDSRFSGKNYVIFSFVYHKKMAEEILKLRNKIEEIFRNYFSIAKDIEKVNANLLNEIENDIKAEFSK